MEIIEFFQSFSSDFLNILMLIVTYFGDLYFLMSLVCVIYWCYNKEVGYKIAIVLSCSVVLNNFIKLLVESPRPLGFDGLLSFGEYTATGYSFPSGHTQNITTFGTGLFILTRNKLVFVLGSILVLVVGVSRIYLGLHWPIDILGGFVLALIVSIALNEMLVKLSDSKVNILIGVIILIFAVCMIFFRKDEMSQDYFKSIVFILGIYLGRLFEIRYVDFSAAASNMDNVMKLIIGAFTTILIDVLFTYLSGGIWFVSSMVKYFILGFWVIGAVPFIFKLSHLYYKEAYEIINVKYKK